MIKIAAHKTTKLANQKPAKQSRQANKNLNKRF